jgi:ribosomal protein L21E
MARNRAKPTITAIGSWILGPASDTYKLGDRVQLTARAYEQTLARQNAQRFSIRTGTIAGFTHWPHLVRVRLDGHKRRPVTCNIAMWEPLELSDNVRSGPLPRGAGRDEI